MIRRYKKQAEQRQVRVRRQLVKSSLRPRLSVFRSNKYIYAQIIDDFKGITLVVASESEIESASQPPASKAALRGKQNLSEDVVKSTAVSRKIEVARLVGKMLAEKAVKRKITKVVFDRGKYLYHGRVKALASGAREGGLIF